MGIKDFLQIGGNNVERPQMDPPRDLKRCLEVFITPKEKGLN